MRPEGDAGERLLITKGAPESVLPVCYQYEAAGQRIRWTQRLPSGAQATYEGLSAQGYRVLAVAYATCRSRKAYGKGDEHDLTLAGFLTFLDPPLRGRSRGAIAAMQRDGVAGQDTDGRQRAGHAGTSAAGRPRRRAAWSLGDEIDADERRRARRTWPRRPTSSRGYRRRRRTGSSWR